MELLVSETRACVKITYVLRHKQLLTPFDLIVAIYLHVTNSLNLSMKPREKDVRRVLESGSFVSLIVEIA